MRILSYFGLICIFSVWFSFASVNTLQLKRNANDDDDRSIRKTLNELSSSLKNLEKSPASPYMKIKLFQRILMSLGSVVMDVIHLHSDSMKQTNIRENFNIITEIFQMESKIMKSQNTALEEIRLAGYADHEDVIIRLYEDLKKVMNSQTSTEEVESRKLFLKHYEDRYENTALHLLRGLSSSYNEELSSNLLESTKSKYRCNGLKLRQMCSAVTQKILQGMTLESAYSIFMGDLDDAVMLKALWMRRLNLLDIKCKEKLIECKDEWKQYSRPAFNEIYEQFKDSTNNDLAIKLFHNLTNAFPQRTWFVFVYNSAHGRENHTYALKSNQIEEDMFKIWNEDSKMLTVVSFDMDDHPEFTNQREVMERLEFVKKIANSCKTSIARDPPEKRAGPVYLHYATANSTETGLMTYAIKSNLNVAFHGTSERYLHVKVDLPKKCKNREKYLFELFVLG